MNEHISTICEFTEVPCYYNSIGCDIKKKGRRSMNQHEKEDYKFHLHMSMEKIENLDSTLSSMKIERNTLGLITFQMSEYGKEKKEIKGVILGYSTLCLVATRCTL